MTARQEPPANRAVVLTGASGFIGSHLCRALLDAGYAVTALVRNPGRMGFSHPRLRVLAHTLPESAPSACFSPRPLAFIHCAYQTSGAAPARLLEINTRGAETLLAACREHAVSPFVFLSSMSAHPGALSCYGRGKLRIERSLSPEQDLVIRPGMVVDATGQGGLYGRLVRMIRRFRVVPIFFGGEQPIQTIDVHDLCAGILRCLELGLRGRLTLAEPQAISIRDFYRVIGRRAGVRPWLVPLPGHLILALLHGLERMPWRLPASSENLLGLKALVAEDTHGDLARVGLVLTPFEG